MMKRLIICLGMAACVAGCGSESSRRVAGSQPTDEQQFERLSLQTSRSEAEAILGAASGQRVWAFPSDPAKAYPLNSTLYTQAYYGRPPSPKLNSAMGIPGKIILLFDDKNRLIQKTFIGEDAHGVFTEAKSRTDSVLGHDVSMFHKLDWSVSSEKTDQQANKASDATSEPAPGAASSSHQR